MNVLGTTVMVVTPRQEQVDLSMCWMVEVCGLRGASAACSGCVSLHLSILHTDGVHVGLEVVAVYLYDYLLPEFQSLSRSLTGAKTNSCTVSDKSRGGNTEDYLQLFRFQRLSYVTLSSAGMDGHTPTRSEPT